MTFPKILGAAVLLALSVSAAAACDDYAEELAMAAAVKAEQAAKTATTQQPAAEVVQVPAPTEVATLTDASRR
jgi:hypothetical protein